MINVDKSIAIGLDGGKVFIRYKDGLGAYHDIYNLTDTDRRVGLLIKNKKAFSENSKLNDFFKTNNIEKITDLFALRDISGLSEFFPENKSQNKKNVFDDYPNLSVLSQFFTTEQISLDLFGHHNWVLKNGKVEDHQKHIPFLFSKKADFNVFKQLHENVLKELIFQNLLIGRNNPKIENKISLFVEILSYLKPVLNEKIADDLTVSLLFHFFDDKSLQGNYALKEEFKYLFKIFAEDLLESYQNTEDFKQMIKIKINTNKQIFAFLVYVLQNPNRVSEDVAKSLSNLKQMTYRKILDNFYSEKNRKEKKSIASISYGIDKRVLNIGKKFHVSEKPFKLGCFILFPLLSKTDFEQESSYMGNCVASHYQNYEDSYNSEKINLYFHMVETDEEIEESKSCHIYKGTHYSLHLLVSKDDEWQISNVEVGQVKLRYNKAVPSKIEKQFECFEELIGRQIV